MLHYRFAPLLILLLSFQHCQEKTDTRPLHAEMLPANAQTFETNIKQLNCWVEKERFCVVGVCTNTTANWQKIWLDLVPLDAAGKPVAISKHASVIIPTFSDAVPPSGRSSFFASWPLTDFSDKPVTGRVKIAGAVPQTPGPILVAPMTNALKMMAPPSAGQPANEEIAWQINGAISNPLDMTASRPCIEILIFGTDQQLWFSSMLQTWDPAIKPIFQFIEREGPLQPKEERQFSLQIAYEALPQALKAQKIGHVEILPFEAR